MRNAGLCLPSLLIVLAFASVACTPSVELAPAKKEQASRKGETQMPQDNASQGKGISRPVDPTPSTDDTPGPMPKDKPSKIPEPDIPSSNRGNETKDIPKSNAGNDTKDIPSLPKENDSDNAGTMLVPVTPFSNMEHGYQATNPGFRASLTDASGQVIASGPMSMDAVVNGTLDDASNGSPYRRLVLNVKLKYLDGAAQGQANGQGKLSICMAQSKSATYSDSACKSLASTTGGGNAGGRPFQYIDMPVSYTKNGNKIEITRYQGAPGEGGSPSQIALSLYHPTYAFAAPQKAFKDFQSPLVLALDGKDKFDLINVWDDQRAVRFDLSADGEAVRTGWIGSGSGFLAIDMNKNGKIDSGAELFGEYFRKTARQLKGEKTFADGFAALASFDDNKDGVIDSKDAIFKRLVVWRDLNADGVAQAKELRSLTSYHIKAISLEHKTLQDAEMSAGNEIRLLGHYVTEDGKRHPMADVWFKQRRYSDAVSSR